MRASEFITERKHKKRRQPKWAAYGPGPYGGYGFSTGYSGDGGGGAGASAGVGENYEDDQLDTLDQILNDLKNKFIEYSTYYVLVDRTTGKKLSYVGVFDNLNDARQAQIEYGLVQKTKIVKRIQKNRSKYDSFDIDEGWKDAVTGATLGTAIALGGSSQSIDTPTPTQPVVKSTAPAKPVQKLVTGSPHEALLKSEATKSGLSGTELAAFLSQCAHETLNFKRLSEFGNKLHFKKYEKKYSPKKAQLLGNIHPGDGIRFKGRGYIQLTGRYNYERAAKSLDIPLDQHPELLEQPEIAAKVAVWYWKHRVAPKVDDFHDVHAVTRAINPGMKGLQDRAEKFKKFVAALG